MRSAVGTRDRRADRWPGVPSLLAAVRATVAAQGGAGVTAAPTREASDANHIHSVWRNSARDFGGDPLRAHLAEAHGLGRERHAGRLH